MPSKRSVQRFSDVIYNVDAIRRYTKGMTREKFFADGKTRDATLHCLLRISEAAKKLGKTAEELVPEQPWRRIRDLGNRLRTSTTPSIRIAFGSLSAPSWRPCAAPASRQ